MGVDELNISENGWLEDEIDFWVDGPFLGDMLSIFFGGDVSLLFDFGNPKTFQQGGSSWNLRSSLLILQTVSFSLYFKRCFCA